VQEKLEHHRAIFGEHPFEIEDVPKRGAPGRLRNTLLDTVFEHASIPALIEDHHFAAVRHLLPEAPEPGIALLKGASGLNGVNLEAAWIQALGERRNGSALAGCVPAFENHGGGDFVIPTGFLQIVEPPLESREPSIVFFARQASL
jgi:hypothetical protein